MFIHEFYCSFENLVLRARAETKGYAASETKGMK
jgi:hypothetical protein